LVGGDTEKHPMFSDSEGSPFTIISGEVAAAPSARVSPQPGAALPRRIANYFGLLYPSEFAAAALLLLALIFLRGITIAHYRFGSDEPQHLHVVWGWARGFVQYRDLADNHMPLFQLLCAPIYSLIGDRATVLYWMRLALQPLYLVAFWCTYRIGSLLFSRRIGIWAAILVGLSFDYAFCSVEFRTDNLWAPLWLVCLMVLLNGRLTIPRAVIAGLIMGLCFGVSMKSSLMVTSILVGGLVTLMLVGRQRLGITSGQIAGRAAAFLACAVSVPVAIAAAFAFYGIWPQFRYWVFDNNIVPGVRNHPVWWVVIFIVGFPLVILGARRMIVGAPNLTVGARQSFVSVTAGFFFTALLSFWPFLSRQDYLPFYPLAFVIGTGIGLTIWDRWAQRRNVAKIWRLVPVPAWFGAFEFLLVFVIPPLWQDKAKLQTDLLRDTLKLTNPGDFVMDRKGETVFRQRCFYPVVETFTEERFRRGLMGDNAIQRCIDSRTCVATLPDKMPAATFRWIEEHYLAVGPRLRVAGVLLNRAAGEQHFEIVIPASYKIISRDHRAVTGVLDGQRYEGSEQFLWPGRHTFVQSSARDEVAVLWAQAVDRYFTPLDWTRPTATGFH
jgi:hypothetical protein